MHLRRTELIPLPSPETLKKMLTAMSNSFGFNDATLDAIENALKGKTLAERVGMLIFDEVKVTDDLGFNTQTLGIDGLIHLDPEATSSLFVCPEEEEETMSEEDYCDPTIKDLADHCLVVMYRPLLGNWVQPFGVFAARGAASGNHLFKILLAGLIRLESRGARVIGVICDGAQSNKSLWQLAGIGISSQDGKEIINNFILHPTAAEWKVYFILDPPHAFKCIRNHIYNKIVVQVYTTENVLRFISNHFYNLF